MALEKRILTTEINPIGEVIVYFDAEVERSYSKEEGHGIHYIDDSSINEVSIYDVSVILFGDEISIYDKLTRKHNIKLKEYVLDNFEDSKLID